MSVTGSQVADVPLRILAPRPTLPALAGAFAIAFSGILYRYADVSPSTGAFFRCLYAVPPLLLLAWWEDRRLGGRPWRMRAWAWLAGAFFAADLILWHRSIEYVGAGLATVLGNTQVVLVGVLAWLIYRERPATPLLVAIPVAMGGIVLISGVLEDGAYGEDPVLGVVYGVLTGIAYTGFLLTLRHGSSDLRRMAGPLCDATVAAALLTIPAGLAIGDLDLTPPLSAQGWLIVLALSSQVLGWLLITISLPRLPAVLTSVLLTLQPVLSVLFAAALLGESPSRLQLVGVAAILSGLLLASAARRGRDVAPADGIGRGAAEQREREQELVA
ncbi:MAG TPA: DMT family transporter [Gaiellaceae bacterium]|nr:DMT family transporter [Gaiellaceae bacterium]